MKPNPRYEQCQSADRLEAILAIASVLGSIVAVVALFTQGWLPCVILLFMSLLAFVLSRAFDLFASMLAAVGRLEQCLNPEESNKEDGAT